MFNYKIITFRGFKMRFNALSIMVIFLLAMVSTSVGVLAGISPDYDIDRIEIDGRAVSESDVNFITLERGDSLDLEIWVTGKSTGAVKDDIKVKAWIGGYENRDVDENIKG